MSPEGRLLHLRRPRLPRGSSAKSWGVTQTLVPVYMNLVPLGRTCSAFSPVPSPVAFHHAAFRQAAVRSSRARPTQSQTPESPQARADQAVRRPRPAVTPAVGAAAAPEAVSVQAAGP